MKSTFLFLFAAVIGLMTSCGPTSDTKNTTDSSEEAKAESQEVNIYSHRFYDTDKALFERFEELTGIKVNVKMDKADRLIQLLQTEGENTPADLLVTTDIGRVYYAKELGLLRSMQSDVLNEQIPSHLRDAEGQWFGITKRARVIMYNEELVKPEELSTYENLASDEWKGQISVRSSTNVYNKSLMASLIANNGRDAALEWAQAVVANMATEPKGNDRDQLKNIVSGTGKVALANTYYLGLMKNSENEAERAAAEKIKPFFPNQDGRGAHVNISGAAVTKHAKNAENAMRLIEFLTSEEAQTMYAEANYEFPVNPNVQASELLRSWGDFKEDEINLEEIGRLQTEAISVFEEAGWN